MVEPLNILMIEDRNADFLMVERHLKQNGLSARCSRVDTLEGIIAAVGMANWDLVLSDYNVPQLNFLESLNVLRQALPDLSVIMVTGTVGEEKAVELLKSGVQDFVFKDNLARLVPAIERSIRDASERRTRRATEQALQKSEVHFRSIFSNSPVAIGIGEAESGLMVDVNDAWLLMFGYERDEIIGRTTAELFMYVKHDERNEILRLINEGGQVVNREVHVRNKAGDTLIVLYTSQLIELGGELLLQVMLTNVTDHKMSERALAQSEAKLRSILNNIGIGVAMISPAMEVLEMNHLLHEWYPAVDLSQGRTCYSAFNNPGRDTVCDCCPTQKTLQDGQVHEKTTISPQAGGSRNLHIVSSPIHNAAGEVTAAIEIIEDITEKLSLESQLRQSQKMEAVGQLAGGVAHDFNNILSAIFGYSNLLLDLAQDNEPVKNYVEEIMKASTRAEAITQGLLAFSRKQIVNLGVIDIREVILGFESFLRRLIREDVELMIRIAEESFSVMADRGQIEQVIMNLATNARDAMPNGGKLSLAAQSVTLDQKFIESHGYGTIGEFVMFSVADSGDGMDKKTQSHIFEPFFTTKEQGKGTGLGLSMAFGIIKKHDGFINVYSEPGTGTIFKIYLPRVHAAVPVSKAKTRETAALHGGAETILVCEDDAALRRLSTTVLSHYGYRVIEAVDGQDAVDRFMEFSDSIHLVIIDAIMPKKNGKEVGDELKKMRPNLKTVFVSGYTRNIFDEDTMFDDHTIFIQKPFSPNHLVAKVRELLDKH